MAARRLSGKGSERVLGVGSRIRQSTTAALTIPAQADRTEAAEYHGWLRLTSAERNYRRTYEDPQERQKTIARSPVFCQPP